MLDFFMQVQEPSGGGGAGGNDAYNSWQPKPSTPTHAFMVPVSTQVNSGFEIWDISNPAAMTRTATHITGTGGSAYTAASNYKNRPIVCIKNGYAYYATISVPQLKVFDVSNPNSFSLPTNEVGSLSVNGAIMVSAHPTKDILWVVHTNSISTVDISNPSSPSLILTVSTIYTSNSGATMSFDGEYCWIVNGGNVNERFELNASNEPSNSTMHIHGFPSAPNIASIAYAEGSGGNAYLIHTAGSNNILGIIELDGSRNPIDTWSVANATLYDDTRVGVGMPYGSNYHSDDLSIFYWEMDDWEFNIASTSPAVSNSFTARASFNASSGNAPGYPNFAFFDLYDQYVFVIKGADSTVDAKLTSFEWSALGTLSQLDYHDSSSATEPFTTLCNKICLYTP